MQCEVKKRERGEGGVAHVIMNIEWDYSYYQPWLDNE